MRLKFFIFVFSLTIAPVMAQVDLGFALTPALRSGLGSNEIWFSGALTNLNATKNLFLNDIQISFAGSATNHLIADTNVFFSNVPGILSPGEIYRDAAFGVQLDATIPPGNYAGNVTIQGGTNILKTNNLATQGFQISLPSASLNIVRSNTLLVLSWPSPPAGFVQANADLSTTNWVTVTNMPAITDGRNQLMLSPMTTNQFFRLKYP